MQHDDSEAKHASSVALTFNTLRVNRLAGIAGCACGILSFALAFFASEKAI